MALFSLRIAAGFVLVAVGLSACSRTKYRLAADVEAYGVIAERNCDPRWMTPEYSIELDPRSRYFDSYNPDCPPMPEDDPASHRYMHCVDGISGWKYWHDNGIRYELENPAWREMLEGYVQVNDAGAIELNLESALRLAYMHSPSHQRQLETVYLSALDVTTERFRLDTQFFSGYNVAYNHNGGLVPASLGFDSTLQKYVVSPPLQGAERNRLTVGRATAGNPALNSSRRFATAGQLLAGFANSFVFEFTGSNANLSASLANFTFLQPLLQGAGKDIALEQLTFFERTMLANLRAYGQFRQGFYTQVSIGELGVSGPQRGASNTTLNVFGGQGGVNGYVGLLQQLQQIRNSEDNLKLQERTLARLEYVLERGLIDLVQVDQFRQNVERERASLLTTRNNYERALDTFKISTLGLPPNVPVELDDSLIEQFQLVDRSASAIQDSVAELFLDVGSAADAAVAAAKETGDDSGDGATEIWSDETADRIHQVQLALAGLVEPIRDQITIAEADMLTMEPVVDDRKEQLDEDARQKFERELQRLDESLTDLKRIFSELELKVQDLQVLRTTTQSLTGDELNEARSKSRDLTVVGLNNSLLAIQGAILIQARARLERVTIERIELKFEDAFDIALANRLDFMNGRAALVNTWRQIQVKADALQSVLNVSASGDLRTAKNNPASFRSPTTNLQLGVEFDAPFTRLVERNEYREALINYQRDRRALIQSQDSLHLGLRVLLRQIEQLRLNLDIQRRAVTIAVRRVDATTSALNAPVRPPPPGQRPAGFGPTAAFNLLSAQSALRDTQNAFLGAWVSYYAAKMRLARELGVMALDPDGRWVETPPPSSLDGAINDDSGQNSEELPPPLLLEQIEMVNSLPEDFQFDSAGEASLPETTIVDSAPISFDPIVID